MSTCKLCGKQSGRIAGRIGVCLKCIRTRPIDSLREADGAHRESRFVFDLPEEVPCDPDGVLCGLCMHECRIPDGEYGYCGVRFNSGGKLCGVSSSRGNVSSSIESLPSNCVSGEVCAGCSSCGYPDFSHSPGPEISHENISVFYNSCNLNCLFCQNWHYRNHTFDPPDTTASDLIKVVGENASCLCHFGGDPSSQPAFAITLSEKIQKSSPGDIMRICWETNGSMNPLLLDRMVDISLKSGGCVKFDLKAFDENLHRVLTGAGNRQVLDNFRRSAKKISKRKTPPLITAATCLVTGYVDAREVEGIASFIASVNPSIPYFLLGFAPSFYMDDLPATSREEADECLEAARGAGLKNVYLENF